MNWNQLHYILTIAEEKNITRAAKKLYLSQPSLSLSLKLLEEELGITLFDRSGGSMELTYAGQLFCDWARQTLASFGSLKTKLDDIAADRRQLIRVGVSPHRGSVLLPAILPEFYARFPNCEVHVTELSSILLRKMMDDRELDLMIDIPNPDTVTYQSEFWLNEEILLAVPRSFLPRLHPEGDSIDLRTLADEPFLLLPAEQLLGNISRKAFEAVGIVPNVRLECSNCERAYSLAVQQLGITFVPQIFATRDQNPAALAYFKIQGVETTRQVCLVYPRNAYQSGPLRGLLELFRQRTPQLYGLS